ncbi:hypothetical protein LNKW23_19760 [Paralimibaculum aggregatum]|uniref:Cytoplasmic protein n=1 Tax=Paralimibaculum aggregatum TaxID=3036245 RepID=A0ABQ6LPG0_9RHOB|nr:hypothetical protein [Limibaculum sp. NKW23]GMG82763.1 hypothetical protein LNKW23_19760 [Limibaculum sp. NKW23]
MTHAACLAALCAATLLPSAARAVDPVVAHPGNYSVLIENDRVRVIAHRDMPGDRTVEHDHPAFVLVALRAFERRITLPDGRVIMRKFAPGDVIYSGPQTHIGENIGTTPTEAVLIELR